MAADALAIIPGAVLRNLADKLYEKRKNAALEVTPFNDSFLTPRGPRYQQSRWGNNFAVDAD
jgi:hypothetical protein